MNDNNAVQELVTEIESKLSGYRQEFIGLTWREKVLLLVDITKSVKILGINSNYSAAGVASRERIRLYLVEHVGIIISASELEVVSGISEYGRRIRELRVQDGYKIITGNSKDVELGINIGRNEYMLLEAEPDMSAARRWHIANRIRREANEGSKGRILKYLKENTGQIITSEELAYVARASEFGRRVRELRTEDGYAIATRFTGRPDLKMSEYVLESEERVAEPHDRKIPFAIQKRVYERSKNACELCGWNHSLWKREDPRILELHHIYEHARGGMNTENNLLVLCSRCHDDIHAGRQKLPKNIINNL